MESNQLPSEPLSALLSFTAENSRSYRDEVHLSLLAGRLTPKSVVRHVSTAGQPVRVLPAAGIFGANASGKSTLLKAMADMRAVVIDSFRFGDDPGVLFNHGVGGRNPFWLTPFPDPTQPEHVYQEEVELFERPTRYEVDLIIDGVRWQYGVALGLMGVSTEFAYHYPNGRQALVFRRECDSEGRGDVMWGRGLRVEGRGIERFTHFQVLLLSVAGAANWEPLQPLFAWFQRNFQLADSANRGPRIDHTADFLDSPHRHQQVVSLLRAADLGIVDVTRESVASDTPDRTGEGDQSSRDATRGLGDRLRDPGAEDLPLDLSIQFVHRGPRDSSEALDVLSESLGTLVWFGLIGPVLNALEHGSVLLVDELDASLHPHLVRDVVWLFQSPRTNPRAAQLIFNAHDVTLLGDSKDRALERDQVWITEKQHDGATTLYPLSDFRPRHDEAIARRFMQGRYGGVPTTNPAEYVRATEPTDA